MRGGSEQTSAKRKFTLKFSNAKNDWFGHDLGPPLPASFASTPASAPFSASALASTPAALSPGFARLGFCTRLSGSYLERQF